MERSQSSASELKTTHEIDPSDALRSAMEREFPDMRRGVEILVWRMGLGRTRDEAIALAEDVLQEAGRRALDQADAFDPTRSAHAWLYRIAVNVVHEQLRRIKRERRYSIGSMDATPESKTRRDESHTDRAIAATRVYDMAIQQDQNVMELLDMVSPADRQILTYRFVDRLSGQEIAVALGITQGAARVRLSRALDKLTAEYHRSEGMLEGNSEK